MEYPAPFTPLQRQRWERNVAIHSDFKALRKRGDLTKGEAAEQVAQKHKVTIFTVYHIYAKVESYLTEQNQSTDPTESSN